MELQKTKNTIRSSIWGIVEKLVTIVMPFVIRTVLIKTLGIDYVGLGNLFTSILIVLGFAELGFSNAIVYFLYDPVARDDRKKICAWVSLYRRICRIISISIFSIGVMVSPFLKYLIKGGYPNDINIYILFFIYLLNTVFSYLFYSYKKALFYAYQRRDIESKVTSSVMLLIYIVEIAVLLLFKNFYVYVVCLPVATIAINNFSAISVTKMYPWLKCEGQVDKTDIHNLKNKMKSLIGHKIGYVAVNSEDNIIISSFLGLASVTTFTNYNYIISAVSSLVAVFYRSILAGIGNSTIKYSKEKNYNDFLNLNFISCWIIGWCSVCFICLFQPFISLWVGNKMLLDFNTVILFVISFYFMQIRNIVITYKDAVGMWDKDFYKPYVILIINLVLNIWFVNIFGIKGVLIATIFTSIAIGMPWESYVLHKYYFGVSVFRYYIETFIYFSAVCIVSGITYFLANQVVVDSQLVSLFFKMIVCIFVPNTIFLFLSYRTNRFKYIYNHLKK